MMKAVILLLLASPASSFIIPVAENHHHHHHHDVETCLFYRHHRNLDMLTGALDRQIQQIYCPLLEYMKQIDIDHDHDHENDDDDVSFLMKDQKELESKIMEAIESSMTHGPIQKWTTNRPLPVNRNRRNSSSSSSSSSKGLKSNSIVTDQEDTTATTIVNTEPWLPSHDDPMPWFPRELKP